MPCPQHSLVLLAPSPQSPCCLSESGSLALGRQQTRLRSLCSRALEGPWLQQAASWGDTDLGTPSCWFPTSNSAPLLKTSSVPSLTRAEGFSKRQYSSSHTPPLHRAPKAFPKSSQGFFCILIFNMSAMMPQRSESSPAPHAQTCSAGTHQTPPAISSPGRRAASRSCGLRLCPFLSPSSEVPPAMQQPTVTASSQGSS